MGAGSNACYVERVSRVKTLPEGFTPRTEDMCINTEWANFNADCLPRMAEDRCAHCWPGSRPLGFRPQTLNRLCSHTWPGSGPLELRS